MTSQASTGAPPVKDISAAAVWIVCALLFAALLTLIVVNPAILRGELGLVEMGQNLILLISLALMIDTFFRADTRELRIWMGLATLGAIYLLGEEVSWGWHFFHWDVSGSVFENINDQGETNLHNTGGGWLDQKPRAILLFGMILGAVVHPLVKWARKGRGLFDHPWWLAPTLASLPPVVFSQLAALPKKIEKMQIMVYSLDLYRWSEAEEFFMYLFFVTYTLSLRQRLIQRKQQLGASS
ncbi:MAG: hypothetical protein J0L81_14455 [Caulobacterales bacterium]|jgi:hypothetical protein|nr:hypothetical protein [Caulobacterales bacterium]